MTHWLIPGHLLRAKELAMGYDLIAAQREVDAAMAHGATNMHLDDLLGTEAMRRLAVYSTGAGWLPLKSLPADRVVGEPFAPCWFVCKGDIDADYFFDTQAEAEAYAAELNAKEA